MATKKLFWNVHGSLNATDLRGEVAGSGAWHKADLSILPASIKGEMEGLNEVYVSKSLEQPAIRKGLVLGGKFIVARYVTEHGQEKGKGYAYAYAISSSDQVLFVELEKDSVFHHWLSSSNPPLEEIANRSKVPPEIYDPL